MASGLVGAGRVGFGRWLGRVALLSYLLTGPLALTVDLDTPVPAQQTAGSRAIERLRAVQAAQATYRNVHGYYDSLECLVLGNCIPHPYPPRYLSADVLAAMRSGDYQYRFFGGARAAPGAGEPASPSAMSSYAIVATPSAGGARSSFCADSGLEIYVSPPGASPVVVDGRCVDRSTPVP
jgi:hypothetical protein